MKTKTIVKISLITVGVGSLYLGLPGLLAGAAVAVKVLAPVAAGATLVVGILAVAYYAGRIRENKKLHTKV